MSPPLSRISRPNSRVPAHLDPSSAWTSLLAGPPASTTAMHSSSSTRNSGRARPCGLVHVVRHHAQLAGSTRVARCRCRLPRPSFCGHGRDRLLSHSVRSSPGLCHRNRGGPSRSRLYRAVCSPGHRAHVRRQRSFYAGPFALWAGESDQAPEPESVQSPHKENPVRLTMPSCY